MIFNIGKDFKVVLFYWGRRDCFIGDVSVAGERETLFIFMYGNIMRIYYVKRIF